MTTDELLRKEWKTCQRCGESSEMPFIGVTERGEKKYQCPKCYFVNQIKEEEKKEG